jgi:BirA family biotin operon repressor/biotin-[acetyl-CoA-carboxylase] ligase
MGAIFFMCDNFDDLSYNETGYWRWRVKSKILDYLLKHRDEYTTGQQLSEICEVSRQSIHKHINSLKEEGYIISSIHRKGYKLIEGDTINQASIDMLVSEYEFLSKGYFFDQINSTNTYLKLNAEVLKSAIVVANEQTAGRGRLGRTWISAPSEGLWQSLLLRPIIKPTEAAMLTQVAGIAMLQAIEEVTKLEVEVKWPNDLMINGKKVCGILTEMSAELGAIQHVIIGIGVNVNQQVFPDVIKQLATSLMIELGNEVDRYTLLCAFIKWFDKCYQQFESDVSLKSITKILNERSNLVGKEINVIVGEKSRVAIAKEINDYGELIVIENDGTEASLYYGEVSVRIR